MKYKIRRKLAGLWLLVCMTFLMGMNAFAASNHLLFTLKISDGYTTQSVPVYEYTANGKTVAAAKDKRTLTVNRAASQMAVKSITKASYGKKYYKSITFKKAVKLASESKASFTIVSKAGKKSVFTINYSKPATPSVASLKLSTSSVTTGTGLKATASLKATTADTVSVDIKNSSGTVVYEKSLGKGKNGSVTASWDGKANKGSGSGKALSAGTYKLTVAIKYLSGKTYKTASKTVSFTVKAAAKATTKTAAATTIKTGNSVADNAQKWNWVVQLTGDDTTDYLAEVVCQKVLKPGMSEIARAKALYTYMATHFTRISNTTNKPEIIPMSTAAAKTAIAAYGKVSAAMQKSGKAVINNVGTQNSQNNKTNLANRCRRAKTGLSKQVGDCGIISHSMDVLCRHAGLTSDILENNHVTKTGKLDGTGYHHLWCVVKIGGYWYYCDSRNDTAMYNKSGKCGYELFLRGKNFFKGNAAYKELYGTVRTIKKAKEGDVVGNYAKIWKLIPNADCPGRLK